MTPPRWRLILNGKSAGDDALRDAVSTMRQRGIVLDVRVTWEDGDAERYGGKGVLDAVEKVNDVIAEELDGADDTIREALVALAARDPEFKAALDEVSDG